MTDTGATDPYWDPYDIDLDTDPYDVWRRLRDEVPLYRNDRHDFWALSRYADVEAASRDTRVFSSRHGTVLEMMSEREIGMEMLIFMDPPSHTRMRALVSRAFTPRRVAALEARTRELCGTFFDEVAGRSSFDFVQDVAARLPAMVIASLLGVPESDQPAVHRLIDLMFVLGEGQEEQVKGMTSDAALTAAIELGTYIAHQLADRRQHPRDDMFTDLVEAEITDDQGQVRRLTTAEAADFGNLLIAAGTETVARLLGWGAVVLGQHPDQRAELVGDPTLIPNAVEELLRFEAPSPVQGRWVTEDVALHGQLLPEGSKLLLLTGSAGRDDRVYPEPDRFDIRRRFDHHVSFGHGVHFCLGAALARMEGRIGIEETLRRYPTYEVDLDRAVRQHTSTVRGWINVPIHV